MILIKIQKVSIIILDRSININVVNYIECVANTDLEEDESIVKFQTKTPHTKKARVSVGMSPLLKEFTPFIHYMDILYSSIIPKFLHTSVSFHIYILMLIILEFVFRLVCIYK